ncbi:class I SAM-dependent methyltransferase [Altibacter lentus]|uniref:class I SAM-dependent methyltransferase n=1 Tax=Altibacter lentus TaxID=1223410 RepID=UPI00055204F9|nr:class I SAM-dependent methyltransferase [Altibacter lentus]
MNKQQLSNTLRKLGFLHVADKARFYQQLVKNKKKNDRFLENHPEVKLPPDYLIYESHEMSYEKYYTGGEKTAQWLVDYLKRHSDLKNKNILDWGCGPARIIRHLPNILPNDCSFYGSDYNPLSIDWNTKNLPHIHFNLNTLEAKLPYPDAHMDIIYSLSVFTHLSERLHYEWFAELLRVLSPGGIMFITTSGNNYIPLLTDGERKLYEQGALVARGQVKEGHRIYTTFHPLAFMKNLFSNVKILEHIETPPQDGWLPQDIWIVQKPL